MTDRPTPEQAMNEHVEMYYVLKIMREIEKAGMVVGYPDDPEVRRAVLAALPEDCPPCPTSVARNTVRPGTTWWRWLREEAFKE